MVDMAVVALIVDLDGTVWDSARWFAAALGGDDQENIRQIHSSLVGGTNIVRALKDAGMTRGRIMVEATRRLGPPPLFPGMGEALAAFSARGVPLGVATSLPGTLAEPMLKAAGIDAFFATVVHAGKCRNAKPHPRSLLMAAADLGVDPGPNVIYLGDRTSDAEAARRAGFSFVWMSHGYEQPSAASGITLRTSSELVDLL